MFHAMPSHRISSMDRSPHNMEDLNEIRSHFPKFYDESKQLLLQSFEVAVKYGKQERCLDITFTFLR